jgi:hypothetical protein
MNIPTSSICIIIITLFDRAVKYGYGVKFCVYVPTNAESIL